MSPGGFRPAITLFVAHPSEQTRRSLGDEVAGTGITMIGAGGTGPEALDRVREQLPDVALLAVDLPGRGGVEVCADLRAEVPACRVLLLAEHDDDETYAGLQAGAFGCYLLSDPPTTLVKAVRGTMRREGLPTPGWAGRVLEHYRVLAAADDADHLVPVPRLTPAEADILEQIHQGRTPNQVAEHLDLTEHLVRVQAGTAIAKLQRALADDLLLRTPTPSDAR